MIREKKGIGMIAAIILAVIFTAAALHFTASEAHSRTYTGKYWLKVNEQQNGNRFAPCFVPQVLTALRPEELFTHKVDGTGAS